MRRDLSETQQQRLRFKARVHQEKARSPKQLATKGRVASNGTSPRGCGAAAPSRGSSRANALAAAAAVDASRSKPKGGLLGAFGKAEGKTRESPFAHLADAAQREKLDGRLGVLEKKDQLSTQLEGVKLKMVQAYRCHDCDYLSERVPARCRDESHRLTTEKVAKRWFACKKCGHGKEVLKRVSPAGPCEKCGHPHWESTGQRRAKAAVAPADEFLARGVEHGRFLGADPAPKYKGRMANRSVPLPS